MMVSAWAAIGLLTFGTWWGGFVVAMRFFCEEDRAVRGAERIEWADNLVSAALWPVFIALRWEGRE